MANENEIKTGLWKKQSQKGTSYYSGSVDIEGKKYWVTLFVNDTKRTEKSPDMNLLLREAEENPQVTPTQTVEQPQTFTPTMPTQGTVDFSQLTDDEIPF